MEIAKVNVAGINIAYVRRGRGVPLVLLHGYPLDHSLWDEVVPMLENDFDLIMPDLRGFGESDVMEADRSIIDYASDIAALLTHLGLRKALLAGHSMGGYVALAFLREYPERAAGLGLVSSQVVADSPETKEARVATAQRVLKAGVGEVAESMPPKLSADARIQARARGLISRQRAAGVANALYAMAERPDSSELFSSSTLPVVILHGEVDALISVERGRQMKSALPSAHYVELGGAGHLPMLEDPPAVAAALRFFINARGKGVKLLDK